MPFTVEDGSGVEGANSGAEISEANEYFTERAVTAWTGANSVKQSALIRATDYVEMRFASRFKDTIEFPGVQSLSFPRLDASGVSVGVPIPYKRAIFEYALRALTAKLAEDPVVTTSGLSLVSESHKVGPIEDSFRYASRGPGAVPQLFKSYPAADALLAPLLKSSGGAIR